jgi:quercetin dioxygenase-like cupin family protein
MLEHEQVSTERKLQKATFAHEADGRLTVDKGEGSYQMANSDGTGDPLVAHNGFGADVIRFAAGRGVQPHTHEGDHILFVLAGEGWLGYESQRHRLHAGLCYFVPGAVVHSIEAETALVLIAVGNNHRPIDSAARMTPAAAG